MDEEALEKIDLPFIKDYVEVEHWKKLRGTYLKGVLAETMDGLLHMNFNLHFVVTNRSSCDSPNIQNIPVRNPLMGRMIRSAFVPRPGHVLIEIDFKGAEVCVGACYHRDPNMIKYITDGSDYHNDIAAQMFKLKKKEVPKALRQFMKSGFVFAEFYGSFYKNCAPLIWEEVAKIEFPAGGNGVDRLAELGIEELGPCTFGEDPDPGTFEYLVRDLERDLWNKRFPGYRDWKQEFYADYLRRGHFDMLSGFRSVGVYSKRQVCNHPIQGSAFHCLLWALIELNRWLRRNRMRSLIVGQIHDSMLIDCHESEVVSVVEQARRLITEVLPETWDWVVVPLTVEIEGSDRNWYEKRPLAI
jgi:DNA polymerase-1